MFVRKNKNRSGTVSVQIIRKEGRRYRVVKTMGSSADPQEIERLYHQAKHEIKSLTQQLELFVSQKDSMIRAFLSTLSNAQLSVVGPELVLGRLYDKLGFSQEVSEQLFRHVVIARLVSPGSKLKTVDYLWRYHGIKYSVDSIYRFIDKLNTVYKHGVEQRAYEHTKAVLGGKIGVVFYDITTLYFEASQEDELRRMGFSKDGKAQNPQILLGLLVGRGGHAIGYDLFEGNMFEGHTLMKVLRSFQERLSLDKPVVVADAGLLSGKNIEALVEGGYEYILGARLKNESRMVQQKLLKAALVDGQHLELRRKNGSRLIVHFSKTRAAKDHHNRERGLRRLEKKLKSGKLTKAHINNRGYNKYLHMQGDVNISIDYEKFEQDAKWDGLKGYITNSHIAPEQVIEQYNQLWQIEKAFRISKTDLRIRPVYHRLRRRIEGHICICFVAYVLYKELERRLYEAKAPFSVMRAIELMQTMYQIKIVLPDSRKQEQVMLKMTPEQQWLADFAENLK